MIDTNKISRAAFVASAVLAGRGRGHAPMIGTVQGAAFAGAKIWNSEIWPLLENWR